MLRLNKIVTQVVHGSTTNTVALTESKRAQHVFYFFPQQEKTMRPGSPHSDCAPDDFFKPLRDIKYTHQVEITLMMVILKKRNFNKSHRNSNCFVKNYSHVWKCYSQACRHFCPDDLVVKCASAIEPKIDQTTRKFTFKSTKLAHLKRVPFSFRFFWSEGRGGVENKDPNYFCCYFAEQDCVSGVIKDYMAGKLDSTCLQACK